MTRLVLFLSLLVGLVSIVALRTYQSSTVSNARFDLKSATESFQAEKEAIEATKNPHLAAEETEVAEAPKEVEIKITLDTPQLQNGAKVYASCVVCHGKNGEGKKSQKAPHLAGQFDWYLEAQLVAMKNKTRVNEIMDPYLKKLSAQDMKDVSVYLSKFPWPLNTATAAEAAPAGEKK